MTAQIQSTRSDTSAKHRSESRARLDVAGMARALLRRLRQWVRANPAVLAWLGVALLFNPPVIRVPGPQMDPSWMAGINIASANGWRYGHDIVYTFGPWGYLDVPAGLSTVQTLLGSLYALAAGAALYAALHLALRHGLPRRWVSPVAALVTSWTWLLQVSLGDKFAMAALIVLFLALLRPPGKGSDRLHLWLTVAFGVTAAFLMQVKITYGVTMLLLAVVAGLTDRSWRAALRNVGVGLGSGVLSYLVFWLLAGQRVGDIPAYLRGSYEVTAGYAEAMQDRQGGLAGYLSAALLGLVIAVAIYRVARRQVRPLAVVGIAVATAGVLGLAAKHAFTRHYVGYEPYYTMPAAIVLIALGAWLARRGMVILVIGLLALSSVGRYSQGAFLQTWQETLHAAGRPHDYRASAAGDGRSAHGVPEALLAVIGDDPVQVDPWESALPWAYGLNWRPVPVFQQYVAYTPYLDELNAGAIAEAPADQLILRKDWQAMDGRNPVWDPPRYQLAVLCNYTAVAAQGGWSVLRHGENACSAPRDLGSRHIEAGEVVPVPSVADDEVLVARFVPDPAGLGIRLLELAAKPWRTVFVGVDGIGYRVPKAHLTGPLLLAVPASDGAANAYAGFSYSRLSLNLPGTIQFEAITLQ